MDLLQTVIIAAITGTMQTVATVAVLKNDIGWIKDSLKSVRDRLNSHAERIRNVEIKGYKP